MSVPSLGERQASTWFIVGSDDMSCAEVGQNGGSHSVAVDPAASIRKEIEQRIAFDQCISELSQKVFSKNELLELKKAAAQARSNARESTEYGIVLKAYCLAKTVKFQANNLAQIKWNRAYPAGGKAPIETFDAFQARYSQQAALRVSRLADRLDAIENFFNER